MGWLVTKQLQTTTILYYAFFLPGIFIHEFVYWAAAGLLNVRADRVLEWPKQQEVAELKLNFVRLAPKTGPIRLALITASPFVVGVFLIWLIANNVLDISAVTQNMQTSFLADLSQALGRLTSTPDFWLWIYVIFTISNTLTPAHPEHLRGWWMILSALGVAFIVLVFLGTAGEVLVNALRGLNTSLNILSGALGVIIGIDLFMVAVLGTIEAIIERITGNSATFKDGKLITMTRAEMLAQRATEFKRSHTQPQKRAPAAPSGPPSIYRLPLPIPGAPGKETITRGEDRVIEPEAKPLPSPLSPMPGRAAPDMIAGAAEKPAPPAALKPPAVKPPEDEDVDDEDEGDEPTYEDIDESV